ncbi:MAG: DNA polymerase [Candidatus Marinimicrobia bacterium]|nr:DNA polymerase [Candidatus Neomarinimicrobiota bacterium]
MSKFYTNVVCLGNYIFERGIEDGVPFDDKHEFKPTLYIPTTTKTDWRTLENEPVGPVQWGTIKETREAMRKYDGVENMKIYGHTNYNYSYIAETYPKQVDYNFEHLKIMFLDIEVGSEHGFPNPENAYEEVTAITIKINDDIQVWGCSEFKNTQENITYNKCGDERQLLEQFVMYWQQNCPHVITGWNTKTFDTPYLVNRIRKILNETWVKKLSPWGFVREQKIFGMGGKEVQTYEIYGVSEIDYMDAYKKFTYTSQESYRLDHIAHVELGENKLDYSEVNSLHELYRTDYQKFIEYNIQDVLLVDRLENKMKLLEMIISLAYLSKCNYTDVFAQTRMWDCIIYNHLLKEKVVIPQKSKQRKGDAYEGAYVKAPQKGRHKWIVSFDLNSLYPHLIMQYNISPETILGTWQDDIGVEGLLNKEFDTSVWKEKNVTVTPNGSVYRKDKQGFLPKLMESMYNDRVTYKQLMLEEQKKGRNADPNKLSQYYNYQQNLKIALNSAYGAMGNQWFRYYDERNAEAVSVAGQLSVQWAENAVNNYLNTTLGTVNKDYIVAMDTDSLYVCLGDLVSKIGITDDKKIVDFLDKACGRIEGVIEESYKELAEYVNAYQQKMVMKREVIADTGIWTAKKHYILNVHDSEGVRYEEPKLKIVGIEAIKSSTPQACRESLKAIFNIIISGTEDEVISYIEKFKEKFFSLDMEKIAFPRSVNGLKKYKDPASIYTKGTPIHVKGSLIYNYMLRSKKLTKKYPIIQEGEKVKFVYLKDPNPAGDKVISILNNLPKEFELEKYIDYDTQFNKAFVEPLKGVLDVIGWDTERRSSLDNFFI